MFREPKKKSNKKQGKGADASALSASNTIQNPQHLGRGLGSAYAVAVDNLKEQAADMAEHKNSFLGVDKKYINPYENLHCSLLPKDFDPGDKA